MARSKKPEADEPAPSSETVRIATDLMEQLREICFHSRDGRGRRLKLAQVADELLRPTIARRHQAVMQKARQESDKKGGE